MKDVIIKLIAGVDSVYFISTNGKVFSMKSGSLKEIHGKDNGRGYLQVALQHNGVSRHKLVHRLVAEAFIANPQNKETVNHIDNDPTNNDVSNLGWMTLRENNEYGTRGEFMASISIPVLCVETGIQYPSAGEASRQTKINRVYINQCTLGKRDLAGGFHWRRLTPDQQEEQE